jgi:hypothetical protein
MDIYSIIRMITAEFSFLTIASRLSSNFILFLAFIKVHVINELLTTNPLLSRLCQVAEECAKAWSHAIRAWLV